MSDYQQIYNIYASDRRSGSERVPWTSEKPDNIIIEPVIASLASAGRINLNLSPNSLINRNSLIATAHASLRIGIAG